MSFRSIVGQKGPVQCLKAAYQSDRVAHAYLFVGPDGVGKKLTALSFVKLLLCPDAVNQESCDVCPSCLRIDAGNHPDVLTVTAEGSFIKIEAVREACRRLGLVGFESMNKALLIDEADRLNEESANALLKTLEEPTPRTTLILLVRQVTNVLPTIVSRCQKIFFAALSSSDIVDLLRPKIQAQESYLHALAALSQGSLSRALKYHEDDFLLKRKDWIDRLLDKGYPLSRLWTALGRERHDRQERMDQMLGALAAWYRDILMAKVHSGTEFLFNPDLVDGIRRQATMFTVDQIQGRIRAVAEVSSLIKHNGNLRMCLAKLRADLWK